MRVADQYFIVRCNVGEQTVEAWSIERLPYEPEGWRLELREELRSAIKGLPPNPCLRAVYGSPVDEVCDAENVLIYNLGGSHFARPARLGLRVERCYRCPPPPPAVTGHAVHYVWYGAAGEEPRFAHWSESDVVAEWRGVPMPKLTGDSKPAGVWWAMRTSGIDHGKPEVGPTEEYGLRLVLGVLASDRSTPATIIKPLADGVIAALHRHDGTALEDLSRRLQRELPTEPVERIAEELVDGGHPGLEERRLLWAHGDGVQWNPADDRCVALELLLVPSKRRELAGRLIRVEPP